VGRTLNEIAQTSLYTTLTGSATILKTNEIFTRYAKKGSVLELGPAEGLMTEKLAQSFKNVSVVDASSIFCDQIRSRLPSVKVYNSYFEVFSCDEQFDNIVLGHVLEHVDCPVSVLKHIKNFLKPGGLIFAAVPNARSIHRQAAVIMNILETEHSLNTLDIHHGHQRVFNPDSFRDIFTKAKLPITVFGGYWLKPVSNSQIEDAWSQEMLNAFMDLGEKYPDIAGEIYIVSEG
jgi:2-polyprenyl-3-methyl-5-hydroxy-6-metoxy-1,4-benzoquinol methylase